MPRQKQPKSLYHVVLDYIEKLTLKTAELCIKHACPLVNYPSHVAPNNKVPQLMETLLPHVIARDVSACMLNSLALFTKKTACLNEYIEVLNHANCQKAAETLINSAVYLGTHQLILWDMSDFMKLVLCKHLPKLTELRFIKVEQIGRKSMKGAVKELILNNIGILRELVGFTFHQHCDDVVIRSLSQNCSKLEYLDVSFSKGVTDASIEYIIQFTKLQSLNIWGTFITRESSLQLLNGLPMLETFVADHKGGLQGVSVPQMQLRKYVTSFFTTAEQMASLCPFLNKLTIYVLDCDLLPLSVLNNLQHISLYSSTFTDIERYIKVSGSNLISLSLCEVIGIDLEVITYCTKLKTLELIRSTYRGDWINGLCDYSSPHFQSVQMLTIKSYKGMSMQYLITGYTNLKILDLYDVSDELNDILEEALSLDCLLNLQIIRINKCPRLEMSTIEQLLKECDNLKEFVYLNSEILNEDGPEFQRLKIEVENKNLDIFIRVDD